MPGSIFRRSKGSWTVVIDLGRDPATGKRRQLSRSIKGAKREAEELLVTLLHQRATGIDAPPGRLTVAAYLERWLTDYVEPNTAPKTARTYKDIVRRHLTPAMGSMNLGNLRPQHIQAYYSRALQSGRLNGKGGLSPRSVLRHHQVVHTALRHAVKWQVLSRNPADAVEPPRAARYEVSAPPAYSVQRLLVVAGQTPYTALIHTAVMTGLRQGELLGLRWSDIDFDAGILQVRQVCQWLPGQGFTFPQPKTAKSRRAVALGPDTVRVLRQHKARKAEERLARGADYQDHDLAFTTPQGRPIDASNLRRAWKRIARQSELPALRFHDLRHACASLMLAKGVHPKVVSERLGHSGVGITLDTYSHVLPGIQAEAAGTLERLLANR